MRIHDQSFYEQECLSHNWCSTKQNMLMCHMGSNRQLSTITNRVPHLLSTLGTYIMAFIDNGSPSMTKKPQRKWIVNVKTPTGKLETVIMKFKPTIGSELEDGRVVVSVNT